MRCDSCGSRLEVGDRQARRLRTRTSVTCRPCQGSAGSSGPSDADYRFWADRFGIPVRPGASARATLEEAVLASAVPAEFSALLGELR